MPSTDFNLWKIQFRNYILDDLEVSSLIQDRFYGAYLATLYNPDSTKFPLATFHAEGGSFPNLVIIQKFILRIIAYSNQHYDEAYSVYKAIFEKLGGQDGPSYISNSSGNIVVRPMTTPTENYDEEARLYGITGRFSVVWLP